ncbi:PspC domain-containing protein [Pontibacter qinzhouensis]|uniref:PspC domain-containing protein n=1 Tax=Pontibacter qinzhouensis TaxID=2603253 RepID=A0A5C8JE97_9BACT|nr:DUF2807 domain-containing protein [Pontibacter qinzhouensis]TXK36765.1 PspC domain-containing protein [Pontibacter qinzhouensis]
MKKNISINLQGVLFHIEEDGYELLSRYLDSIKSYFSNYEGHDEIVADIEARMAEIFSARLSPGKQVISLVDVEALITQMGNVTDFEADPVEEEQHSQSTGSSYTTAGETGQATAGAGASFYEQTINGAKKLSRDMSRKMISGVAAGIANYLNIDPLWIRLLFIVLVFGISFTTTFLWHNTNFSFSVGGIFIYIGLWIALPVTYDLPETNVKRLFRDPMDKKLGGVASGIAKFFGIDVTLVRVLFLLSMLIGGAGIMLYIILWIVVPEATTLTEKMQMQGNPVTLSGIEQSLKDNLNLKDEFGKDTTTAKVLMFPVQLMSRFIHFLSAVLGPVFLFLLSLIRVAAGVLLLIMAIGLVIALFTSLFVSMGLIHEPENFMLGAYPASLLMEGFPRLGLVAGFLVGLIPAIFLMLLAIGLLSKHFILRATVGWSLFGVWLISLFSLIAVIIIYSQNFMRSGELEIVKQYNVDAYPAVTLDAYNTNLEYHHLSIAGIKSHAGNQVEVIQRVSAKGRNEAEARRNAQMISYAVVQRDSVLRFDNSYEFKKGAALRDQELNLTLLLPQNKPLRLTRSFLNLLPSSFFEVEYSRDKILRNTWQAKGDYLTCLTCDADTLDTVDTADYALASSSETMGAAGSVLSALDRYSSHTTTFNETDFDKIKIAGNYHLQLKQGSEYDVQIRAEESELEKLKVSNKNHQLTIEPRQKYFGVFEDSQPVLILITVPDLRKLELSGALKADIGRLETNSLELAVSGATKAMMNLQANRVNLDISGASTATLTGQVNHMVLDLSGASRLQASTCKAEEIDIETSGASKAEVHANRHLKAEASGGSSISYSGTPGYLNTDVSGAGKIKRL